MSTRNQRDKEKKQQEKYQAILSRLLLEEDNKYCVECDAKGPRWASWNLGIFICIRCAGIHRNLGVHISKVKSVNLDSWTEEQVTSVENMGNHLARKIYEAHLPADFKRPQSDYYVEQFIRNKYEHKKFMDKNLFVAQRTKKVEGERSEKEKRKEKVIASGKIPSLQKTPQNKPVTKSPVKQTPPPVTAQKFETPSIAEPSNAPPSGQRTLTPVKSASALTDLLSLDTPKSYSSPDLLSLAAASEQTAAPVVTGSESQNDLFGVEKADSSSGKTSKESILALYGSQTSKPAYGVPGGMYIPAQQTNSVGANFGPSGSIPQQNGSLSYSGTNMMGVSVGMQNGGLGANSGMMASGMMASGSRMIPPGGAVSGLAPNMAPNGGGMGMAPNGGTMAMMGMNTGFGMNQMSQAQSQQAYLQQQHSSGDSHFQASTNNPFLQPSNEVLSQQPIYTSSLFAQERSAPHSIYANKEQNVMHNQQQPFPINQQQALVNNQQSPMPNQQQSLTAYQQYPYANQPVWSNQQVMNNQQLYKNNQQQSAMNNQQQSLMNNQQIPMVNQQQGLMNNQPSNFMNNQQQQQSIMNSQQQQSVVNSQHQFYMGNKPQQVFMDPQQSGLQEVQQQMKNMRVSPMLNGQMGQPIPQQQQWTPNFNPNMQQAGFQAQGNMGWGNNTTGHTHSTQLWN